MLLIYDKGEKLIMNINETKNMKKECLICKFLPGYAFHYLLNERKSLKKDKQEQNYDLLQLKYYYSLLKICDNIHQCPKCSRQESQNSFCSTPEYFTRYKSALNECAKILLEEKNVTHCIPACDICAVLPYAISSDLNMVAKNIGDEQAAILKLELYNIVTEYYLTTFGPCTKCATCVTGNDWIELEENRKLLISYLKDKNTKALNVRVSEWNEKRSNAQLLSDFYNQDSLKFEVQNVLPHELEHKKLIYLDFGVYQFYENTPNFQSKIDKFVEMKNFQFVYSPTHMEEICRMNDCIFESTRKNTIKKISQNYEILPKNGFLEICIEPIEASFTRAKNLKSINAHAEENECARFEALEDKIYQLLKWDKETMLNFQKKISNMPLSEILNPDNKIIDNKCLELIFNKITISSLELKDIKNYCQTKRTFSEIREVVISLYELMNALNYHKNKIEKRTKFTYEATYPLYDRKFYRTIKSGFYDIDHICYASKCDYFVTCDKELSFQAQNIYEYIGCKTSVFYCDKNEM